MSSSKIRSALSIGNFDGVHRGHQALIDEIVEFRHERIESGEAIRLVVVTFEPHPEEILKPNNFVPKLSSLEEKIALLKNKGVDDVKVIAFTKQFAQTPAEEFFEKILIEDLDPAFIAVGTNFFFGHNREGTPQKLVQWSKARGIEAEIVEPIEADGAIVSSTRIRKLIQEGQMLAANRLLGRDYNLNGEVVHGAKHGRQIGVPTANILPPTSGTAQPCLPKTGVYLTSTTVRDPAHPTGSKTFASITNVGFKPTFESKNPTISVETHLFDFHGDLYGKQLSVEFVDRIRDEMKFAGVAQLVEQIQKDIAFARKRLGI